MAASESQLTASINPAISYVGLPLRDRGPRPSVPRSHRRETLNQNKENKDSMLERTDHLRTHFNDEISQIAQDTKLPRSVVARQAYRSGRQRIRVRRGVNAHNAWVSVRMAEINKGAYFLSTSILSQLTAIPLL